MFSSVCLIIAFLSLAQSCPSSENLYPCTCKMEHNTADIICSRLDNEQDLVNAASALKMRNYIERFKIENSNFNFIPHNAFINVKFQDLELENSNMFSLTDTDVAFEGMEDTLQALVISNSSLLNTWDWSVLRKLRALRKIEISGGDLESVNKDIEEINNGMLIIVLSNNKISRIYDTAFSKFKNLLILELNNNFLTEVKREIIPNPAVLLRKIDLSYNEIKNFPEDMFENIPNLEWLNISWNKILTLNERTFSPVWQKLKNFEALGNELRCDCRMAWILNLTYPKTLKAECAEPKAVRGHNIETLTAKTLWC
ncbi:oplophorus-luciferin 2-monooxygenase non-catalytic subunit-like [Stegodyphus dumicola]|uniref:oplophorus-luciferin 2-monooxygenase non-catalytic subunit-like n=1 Tax=Stegodyphus dumicola TaxID=202533 RepID=UPI0015B20B81|nr:oplophorus-luciferin 2-monooxygenase non-catalytic subunit-like [Stegodyphus dumicola]